MNYFAIFSIYKISFSQFLPYCTILHNLTFRFPQLVYWYAARRDVKLTPFFEHHKT